MKNQNLKIWSLIILMVITLTSCGQNNNPVKINTDGVAGKNEKQKLSKLLIETINEIEPKQQSGGFFESMYGDLTEDFEKQLKKSPDNVWLRLNLAYTCQRRFQYTKALSHYLTAMEQNSEIADPLIGIGRLCYDVAVLGEKKELLYLSKHFLILAKQKQRIFREQGDIKVYISPPGTIDEFLRMIESKLE